MTRLWWLPTVVLASCGWVYGVGEVTLVPPLDIDGDTIDDDVDLCIAAMLDGDADNDHDSVPNSLDACPFDPLGPDQDLDGIPDACDPFPQLAGDRRRCTMSFYNTDLNARLWQPGDGTGRWTSQPGELISPDDVMPTGTIIAVEPLEGAHTTTYDVSAIGGAPGGGQRFRVIARGNAVPSPADVSCELAGDNTHSTLSIMMGDTAVMTATLGVPMPAGNTFRLAITFGTDVTCRYAGVGITRSLTMTVPLGEGTAGLLSDQFSNVLVTGLAIYDRP